MDIPLAASPKILAALANLLKLIPAAPVPPASVPVIALHQVKLSPHPRAAGPTAPKSAVNLKHLQVEAPFAQRVAANAQALFASPIPLSLSPLANLLGPTAPDPVNPFVAKSSQQKRVQTMAGRVNPLANATPIAFEPLPAAPPKFAVTQTVHLLNHLPNQPMQSVPTKADSVIQAAPVAKYPSPLAPIAGQTAPTQAKINVVPVAYQLVK